MRGQTGQWLENQRKTVIRGGPIILVCKTDRRSERRQPRCLRLVCGILPSCAVVRTLGISKASGWNDGRMCRLEAGFARE